MDRLLKLFNKDRVLSVRLLIFFLILIYIPMALYVNFVHTRTIEAVEKEKKEDIEQILRQTTQSLNFALNNIEEGVLEIINHNGVQVGVRDFEGFPQNYREKISKFIKHQFRDLKDNTPYIDGFACIDTNGQFISSDGKIQIDSEDFFRGNTYKKLVTSSHNILWNYGVPDYIDSKSKDEKKLYLVCEIDDKDTQVNVGYFFVTISTGPLKKLYEETFIGITGEIVIYDENNNPVLNTRNYDLPETGLDRLVKQENFYKMSNTTIADRQYLLGVAPLFPMDWLLVAIVPRDELTKTVKHNLKSNFTPIIFVSLATALIIVIESLILSKVVTEKEMANYRLVLSEKMNEKLRMYKHDFTNHLQIIWGLLELKHYDKALSYLIKASSEGMTIREKYEIGIPEIESTIFSVLSKAREKNIDVEMDCITLEPNLPIRIYDLTKILSNLLKNAMYALEKADAYDKKLKIRIYEELGEYVFEVINNVPIIPEELRRKIFQKGFTTKGNEGSGLGLHIVKRLAEKNNGTIELKVDEEGNHFIVRFPH
ncbi:ATP-binding protein [Wukongibacter baidiensis]|uniref:ATP-binding protein n=1 Tax=Wukongibacter baidiensis TaxID=1723361 RepID=UPI003D7FC8BD